MKLWTVRALVDEETIWSTTVDAPSNRAAFNATRRRIAEAVAFCPPPGATEFVVEVERARVLETEVRALVANLLDRVRPS